MKQNEAMTITEFLEARIAEDEKQASALLRDLEEQVAEEYAGEVDERGPFTPARLLSAQMWAQYDGQRKRRSFAKGHQIAYLANPARVLAECAAKRAIIDYHQMLQEQGAHDDVVMYHATGMRIAMRFLASSYADHPDYKQEWSA